MELRRKYPPSRTVHPHALQQEDQQQVTHKSPQISTDRYHLSSTTYTKETPFSRTIWQEQPLFSGPFVQKLPPFQDLHYRTPYINNGSSSIIPHWEAPKFSFNVPNQAGEWEDILHKSGQLPKAMDIDPDTEDKSTCGWWQIKMMFEAWDCQALQTLLGKNIITPKD